MAYDSAAKNRAAVVSHSTSQIALNADCTIRDNKLLFIRPPCMEQGHRLLLGMAANLCDIASIVLVHLTRRLHSSCLPLCWEQKPVMLEGAEWCQTRFHVGRAAAVLGTLWLALLRVAFFL